LRHDPPAAPAVRDELERILSSETFKRSERARELLSYLVGREQLGEAERLKGYAIAVDVFGKDSEFDSSTDAVVRVQAGRLRELLSQYYAAEGRSDPIRMVIPRGSYVPAYEDMPEGGTTQISPAALANHAQAAPAEANAAANSRPAGPNRPPSPKLGVGTGQVQLLWGALVFVALLSVAVSYQISFPGAPAATNTAAAQETAMQTTAIPEPSPEALPTVRVVAESDDAETRRVATEFKAAFSGYDTLDLIDSGFADQQQVAPDPMSFVLTAARADDQGGVRLELKSLGSGKVLLNRILPTSTPDPEAIADAVANVASGVAPVSGLIYGYLDQAGLQSQLGTCLTLNDAYYLEQGPARHLAAYQCLERLVGVGAKSPLVYSELAALHIEAKTDHYPYPAKPSEEEAMALARRAVQSDPTSPYAHRAVGFVYSQMGNRAESIRWMRKAYELNTYDLSMAASYGYALVFSADYREGASILQRAVDASSSHPTWWDYGLFLAEFMLDDMDKASRATDALLMPKKSHYIAARLVVAQSHGDQERTGALAAELVGTYPNFAADPSAVFEAAKYPPDLARKFTDALKVAGIGKTS
jgi:tetratricopeptide (TPR) repeat protein